MHDPVDPNVSFPALEEQILGWWRDNDIAGRALRRHEGGPEYVFYEGPPFANAPPGVHSVLPRALKDIFTRYHAMKGRHVPRKAGWDCHGLPAELEIEKRLGFTEKKQIVEYGVGKFNDLCRQSVTEYIDNYVKFSERMAYWLDYDNAYMTMANDYIESVWWSLSELHRRGLLFEADRVTPYCPRCETPLSDHELGQEGVYQEVTDPGITVAFPLVDPPEKLAGASLAVWTTTPWTLISNLAAAVSPDVSYAVVREGDRRLVMALDLAPEDAAVEATVSGSTLEGLRYRPPFNYAQQTLGDHPQAWRVLTADFVSATDGTGIVHMAAAFGADDLEACRAAGIPTFNPVDASGRFDHRVPEHQGVFVKDADPAITTRLQESGLLLRNEPYLHAYPHCWRCKTPLLYYALNSWYVKTTARRERMLELNDEIKWFPGHIQTGRFGKWLEGNVDWSLSRYRFWGTPLPIWRCPDGHDTPVESRADLGRHAGRDLTHLDLHRPHVDEVTFPCPECKQEARRVTDLIDVWYDSGAMPYAQYGYPHYGTEEFRRRFPADFIAEGLDQTRGWFYSLLAESTLLFDETAYRAVMCHGLIMDAEGRKMSKSVGNILDAWDIWGRYGSDALRFYFFTAGDPADNRRVGDEALEQVVRGPLLTLWNTYRLYVLYATIDQFHPDSWPWIPPHLRTPLDRWAMSELHQLVAEVDEALESYDLTRAGRRIIEFVDDLSNWYVRRSRRRFWRPATNAEAKEDKACAYWTLWTCLSELTRVLAPFTPFLSEALYQNLVRKLNDRAADSVHLTDFPSADAAVIDPGITQAMVVARELCSLGRSARTEAGIKVRKPLASATVLVPPDLEEGLDEVLPLVAEELNVREILFAEDAGMLVRTTLKPNFSTAGPAFGPKVQALAQALADAGDAADDMADVLEEGESVEVELPDGEMVRISAEHVDIRREPAEGTAFAYQAPFGVSLDLTLTPELEREGLARELVHQLQGVRRDEGLDVTDRARLVLNLPPDVEEAVREHEPWLREELLVAELTRDGTPQSRTVTVEGREVGVTLTRA